VFSDGIREAWTWLWFIVFVVKWIVVSVQFAAFLNQSAMIMATCSGTVLMLLRHRLVDYTLGSSVETLTLILRVSSYMSVFFFSLLLVQQKQGPECSCAGRIGEHGVIWRQSALCMTMRCNRSDWLTFTLLRSVVSMWLTVWSSCGPVVVGTLMDQVAHTLRLKTSVWLAITEISMTLVIQVQLWSPTHFLKQTNNRADVFVSY